MAEQNRKTKEQIRWRMKAEDVVDAYLDYLLSDADQESIAREGRTMLGVYSEHGGIPRGSGFSGFCKLPGKIDRMKVRRVTENMRNARDLMVQIDSDQVSALFMDRCYRGRVKVAIDPFTEDRIEIHWDDRRCASHMGISPEALRKRISRGYQAIESILKSDKAIA